MIHPDDLADAQRALREFVAQETHAFGKPYEFRVITAQGDVKWVETTGVNLVDDPAVRGIVLHTRDVTEQHEAAEQLRAMAGRLGSLVAHLPVGVMLADEKGQITYVNRAAAELLRLDGEPDDLVRAGPKAMWDQMRARHPDFEEHLRRAQEIIGERRSVLDERVVVHDGRTLSRSHVPIVDGTVYRGFLWIFQDLTEQVTMVAEREHLLEVEQRQNIRLRGLDSLKSDLVASVSHELRTPLTSIMSFTKLLLDGLGVDAVTDQAEFIGVIGRNTERILRLVDDLLLLDRLESERRVEHESVDFAGLVAMAVSSIQPLADERGIELVWQVTGGPPVKGDEARLAQVVDNLLANAVRFTPSGGEVRVEAVPRPATGGSRCPTPASGSPSTSCTSSSSASSGPPTPGSRRCPARASGWPSSATWPSCTMGRSTSVGRGQGHDGDRHPPGGRGPGAGRAQVVVGGLTQSTRILVIEDDADIRRSLQVVLGRVGYDLFGSEDGYDGLDQFQNRRHDLVLLDISLPGLDGWAVLERIRSVSQTPVLMLTARGLETDKARGLLSGADDYLTKPYSNDELVARINALLRRSPPSDGSRRLRRRAGAGGLLIQTCEVAEAPVRLTPTEFRLLTALLRHADEALTRELLDLSWHDPASDGSGQVKFTVLSLRRKLGWADLKEPARGGPGLRLPLPLPAPGGGGLGLPLPLDSPTTLGSSCGLTALVTAQEPCGGGG